MSKPPKQIKHNFMIEYEA